MSFYIAFLLEKLYLELTFLIISLNGLVIEEFKEIELEVK